MSDMSDAEEGLTPLVTECPKCQTRFRVTQSQLQIADGRVRCGACLTVFKAAEQLQLGEELDSGKGSGATVDEMLDDLLEELEDLDKGLDAAPLEVPPDGAQQDGESNEWLLDNLFPELEVHEDGAPAERERDTEPNPSAHLVPLDEPEEPPIEQASAGLPAGVEAAATTSEPQAAQPAVARTVDDDEEALDAAEVALDIELAEQNDFASTFNETYGEPPTDAGRRRWWVYGAMLLGVLLLLAQIFAYLFDRWSFDPEMRWLPQSVCGVLGCELDPLRSLEQLRTTKVVVRSHPEVDDALVVDAILLNDAPFAQPFPSIYLTFTDVQGDVVAGREFFPSEYLAGELAGASLIESMTPVRVSFEIADPGSEAVGYTVELR